PESPVTSVFGLGVSVDPPQAPSAERTSVPPKIQNVQAILEMHFIGSRLQIGSVEESRFAGPKAKSGARFDPYRKPPYPTIDMGRSRTRRAFPYAPRSAALLVCTVAVGCSSNPTVRTAPGFTGAQLHDQPILLLPVVVIDDLGTSVPASLSFNRSKRRMTNR